jgi:hypothetical protein
MTTSIQPVLVSRGVTADAISFHTIFDDQTTQATWWVGYGNLVTPEATEEVPEPATVFTLVPNQALNLTMTGADYTAWTGAPAQAETWILKQLNLLPA